MSREGLQKKIERIQSSKFSKEIFNVELFLDAMSEKGYNQRTLSKRMDIDPASVSSWVTYKSMPKLPNATIICELLGVSRRDLILRGKRASDYKNMLIEKYEKELSGQADTEEKSTEESKEEKKDDLPKFRRITSSRVDECFNTINDNVLLLASVLLRGAKETSNNTESILKDILDRQNEMMMLCCDMMSRLDTLERKESIVVKRVEQSVELPLKCSPEEVVVDEVPLVKEKLYPKYTKESVDAILRSFSSDVKFKEFRGQVMNMAAIYSDIKGIASNQALSEVYKKMTNVYGIVFTQLRKEYKEKNGSNPSSTLQAVYSNEMYRSIMHSILSDMVSNAVEEVEVRNYGNV